MLLNAPNSQDGRHPQRHLDREIVLTPLIPLREAVITPPIPPDEKITGRSGLPAERLTDVPPQFHEIAVLTLPAAVDQLEDCEGIAFRFVSGIRYRGAGKELVVIIYLLSAEAALRRRDAASLSDRLPMERLQESSSR